MDCTVRVRTNRPKANKDERHAEQHEMLEASKNDRLSIVAAEDTDPFAMCSLHPTLGLQQTMKLTGLLDLIKHPCNQAFGADYVCQPSALQIDILGTMHRYSGGEQERGQIT